MKFVMEIPLEHYATNQRLIESICDLTRKIGLLEDLMEAARERRMSREIKARFADSSSSEFSVQA
jgi:hypothetical protein